MNKKTYGHIFSENSKESLSEFFKAAKNSEAYHDFQHIEKELKEWKPFIENLAEKIELTDEIIELSDSEQEYSIDKEQTVPDIKGETYSLEESHLDKFSSNYLVFAMQKEQADKIQEVYSSAKDNISLQTIVEMGVLMKDLKPSDSLLKSYWYELMLKMMCEKVEDAFKELLNYFYSEHSRLFIEQIVYFLKSNENLDVFLVYLNAKSSSDRGFFSILLRAYLESYEGKLSSKDLYLVDFFISKHTEYDLLSKAVEILSKNALQFKGDKDYGKLLMKIIENLGPHLESLKTPIDSILSIHSSIWKIKIRKKIEASIKEI